MTTIDLTEVLLHEKPDDVFRRLASPEMYDRLTVIFFLIDSADDMPSWVDWTMKWYADWQERDPLSTPPIVVAAVRENSSMADDRIRDLLSAGANLCLRAAGKDEVLKELEDWLEWIDKADLKNAIEPLSPSETGAESKTPNPQDLRETKHEEIVRAFQELIAKPEAERVD